MRDASLANYSGKVNDIERLALRAPVELGDYSWMAEFPPQTIGGIPHGTSSTRIGFNVKPHATSMAVWDYPSVVTMGGRFRIRVGVNCSEGCTLTGSTIEVCDDKARSLATSMLGGVKWPGTKGLYWADVVVTAPSGERVNPWTARFPAAGLALPHEASIHNFTFRTGKPPDYTVIVKVFQKDTNVPIKAAVVSMLPYRAESNAKGLAKLKVPKGRYELDVFKGSDYKMFRTIVEVSTNVELEAGLVSAPTQRG